mmetsp:Transcript_53838/g.151709  ORF Transcript_53838/g.151709 Transcript_53838/m.151709 type:complete len:210 (+) Transcript_53838:37-666(+)
MSSRRCPEGRAPRGLGRPKPSYQQSSGSPGPGRRRSTGRPAGPPKGRPRHRSAPCARLFLCPQLLAVGPDGQKPAAELVVRALLRRPELLQHLLVLKRRRLLLLHCRGRPRRLAARGLQVMPRVVELVEQRRPRRIIARTAASSRRFGRLCAQLLLLQRLRRGQVGAQDPGLHQLRLRPAVLRHDFLRGVVLLRSFLFVRLLIIGLIAP